MREQLRDRHARDRPDAARRRICPAGIVELELALLAQLHDAGGGEALRVRGDAKAVARRERLAGREIGGTEGALEDDAFSRCVIAIMQPGCCEASIWNSIQRGM